MIADFLSSVGQIIGVDANAVAADEARLKWQEVPLRRGCRQHFGRVEPELVEDDRELVHQGYVEVALRVLDHLRCLGHLD